jgi:uncharacterized protein YdhG (YjbR/CyaY superfamily)
MDKQNFTTIDEYIAQFPTEIQLLLTKIRAVIQKEAPDAIEKISYQMPTYYYHGNLVHFAAYEKHIGFYPAPSGIAAFQDQLSGYKFAKGSVQFPLSKPMPFDLIAEIVRFRINENSNNHK